MTAATSESCVQRSTEVVQEMIREYRFDEACLFLYHLHKWHIEEWREVGHRLALSTSGHNLPMLKTVIHCSTVSNLSACDPLIPGLSRFTAAHDRPELFD